MKGEIIIIKMVIKHLEEGRCDQYDWVTDMAIEALKKQTPKETTSKPWNGINGVPYEKCPTCDDLLWGGGVFDKKNKYCSNCGQRIDWD